MSYFDNINGIKAKDIELRQGVASLREEVISRTIKPLSITNNGTYTADPAQGTYGYSPITVDVQEEPWEPLEDGYSNFWFELTNDTLSPWLNFSAKNNDAVIDWGDGSGEVALDTLTPTHTYSKAGRYVVKVKGVTQIVAQNPSPYSQYLDKLRYIELNSELNSFAPSAFNRCLGLKKAVLNCTNSGTPQYGFNNCTVLESIVLPSVYTIISQNSFLNCYMLQSIILPSAIATIESSAFNGCSLLSTIHIQATNPPTLGTNVFANIASNYIIYVPVGTLSAYQTAWSDYADHIVEEGSQLTRAQLRNIELENSKKTPDTEEMR